MASLKPSPQGQLNHAAPHTPLQRLQGQRDTNGPECSSMDIQRRPSPVPAPRNSIIRDSQMGARMPSDLILLPQPTNSPSRRRPTSMISLSSSQSPPIVTIDGPPSPRKPFVLPKPRFPSRSPTPSPSRSSETSVRSQHALPIIPRHSANASPIPDTERPSVPKRDFVHDSKFLQGGINIRRVHPTSNSVPPPIKRAEKPKISNRPAGSRSNINLDTDLAVVSNKGSPFSTPSSSEDNFEPDTARSRESLSFAKSGSGNQPQQSARRKTIERKFEDASDVNYHSLRPGTHQNGNFDFSSPPNELFNTRPGLPPRHESAKKPEHPPKTRPVSMLARTWTEQTSRQDSVAIKVKPRIPSSYSNTSTDTMHSRSEFMPPPKRPQTSLIPESSKNGTKALPLAQDTSQGLSQVSVNNDVTDPESLSGGASQQPYPDTSSVNRRPPYLRQGAQKFETHYDTKLFDVSSRYICTTGHQTRAWDLLSGDIVLNMGHDEKDLRVTALAFMPGASSDDEGCRIWLGTNYGDIQEVDIPSQTLRYTKSGAHSKREIVKIYRYQNFMWTLDDDGRLHIWPAGEEQLPSLQLSPLARKVPKGHNFSIIIQDSLWIAAGKEVRVFRPLSKDDAGFCVTKQALSQPGAGEITSGAVIAGQLHCVYFGHTDGKITSYSTSDFSCLGIFNVSVYKINSLVGAGSYLWAGYNSGMICVYDTNAQPWTTKKEWQAHPDHPVTNILVERGSLWKSGFLQVASIGMDNTVRIWDGLLEQDWLETDMQNHDTDYCGFREIEAVVVTWNAGASKPTNLCQDEKDIKFFREVLHVEKPPEILVFGFQELVDLDDKKLTAKSFFKGNKKKDASEQEHMSRQYRAWRDFLVRFIEDSMPPNEPYHLLHTASMIGLFSCVFVKASQRSRISNVCAAEIKRGLGGLHGNKGAIILRFILDNTSVCFVNCHLAAGQSQTVHRNNDAAAILESAILPPERDQTVRCDIFVGGGDGTMILDHEICILNGDLNYRIDTMGPDTVIKAVKAHNFSKLLERDQLLVSRRRNFGFRLRVFAESPILFAPTYKYDVGSNNYDSSEKHRAPAWCDRILYRGAGKIKQLEYRRHEVQVSDHRPVSGTFKMRIKTVSPEQRLQVWEQCVQRLHAFKQKLSDEAK